MGIILKIILIAVGVILIPLSVFLLAKRRMNEACCLVWGVIAVGLLASGIILNPNGPVSGISVSGFVIVLIIIMVFLYAVLCLTHIISELMRKNNDLAIQVSLLSKENEDIKKELGKMPEHEK